MLFSRQERCSYKCPYYQDGPVLSLCNKHKEAASIRRQDSTVADRVQGGNDDLNAGVTGAEPRAGHPVFEMLGDTFTRESWT